MAIIKIKTLPKITLIKLKSEFIVTFILIGAFQNFEVSAMDEDGGELVQPLLSSRSHSGKVSINASPDDLEAKAPEAHVVVISSDSFIGAQEEEHAGDKDDLPPKIDHTPAEGEMNKIIECLAFFLGGEMRAAVVSRYPETGVGELEKYLIERAWPAATDGPLATIVRDLLTQTKLLREKSKKFKSNHESIIQLWANSMQMPGIVEAITLQRKTFELQNEVTASRATIKSLKLGLGTAVTVSVVGFSVVAFLKWWAPTK